MEHRLLNVHARVCINRACEDITDSDMVENVPTDPEARDT